MKKVQYFICIIAVSFLLSSCNSFLDTNPSDQFTVETFWKTEEHANAGLTGCYRSLFFWKNYWIEMDLITSNATPYNEASGTQAIARGEHQSTTPLIANLWSNAYQGIGRANTFLDKIEGVTMPEATKKRMIGEAKFLRAFYYFHLMIRFGGVPLITESPSIVHATLPRNSKDEVLSQTLKDLTEAANELPNKYTGANLGRVTKGAAFALKARILLYEGKWDEAASVAKQCMDLNVYSLFDDYRRFWFENNKYHSEVIFDINSTIPEFTTGFDDGIFRLNRPSPVRELVDAYLMIDGLPITESPDYDPERPYEKRDPRLLYTVNCIGYPYNGVIMKPSDVVTTGFGLKKYTSYEDNTARPLVTVSAFNVILIRYAEVLLTYAEAKNESTGPDQSVYEALNLIRNGRSSIKMPDIETGLTKEEMRKIIRLERRVELAMEGFNYDDVLRYKTIEKENNGSLHNYKGIVVDTRKFNPAKDYLWPIPYNQILQNPNLTQNPGWD